MKFSRYFVNPAIGYENKYDWKLTLHALVGLAIDVLNELLHAFTLKSLVGGLSAILKCYHI